MIKYVKKNELKILASKKLLLLFLLSCITIVIGSIVVYVAEVNKENSQINSYLDAIWWSVATVTTVGYGDIVPVSEAGRIVALLYMFFGITIIGVFLSTAGTVFYKKRFDKSEQELNQFQKFVVDELNNLKTQQKENNEILNKIYDNLK
ncbi:MAG: potassium channel family protein [Nitrososphaeraceae archaeon]